MRAPFGYRTLRTPGKDTSLNSFSRGRPLGPLRWGEGQRSLPWVHDGWPRPPSAARKPVKRGVCPLPLHTVSLIFGGEKRFLTPFPSDTVSFYCCSPSQLHVSLGAAEAKKRQEPLAESPPAQHLLA